MASLGPAEVALSLLCAQTLHLVASGPCLPELRTLLSVFAALKCEGDVQSKSTLDVGLLVSLRCCPAAPRWMGKALYWVCVNDSCKCSAGLHFADLLIAAVVKIVVMGVKSVDYRSCDSAGACLSSDSAKPCAAFATFTNSWLPRASSVVVEKSSVGNPSSSGVPPVNFSECKPYSNCRLSDHTQSPP